MIGQALRNHDIFQCRPFLADFEVAVAVGAFKVMMQLDVKLLALRLAKSDLLREDEDAARLQSRMDPLNQRQTLGDGDELEGEVEDDDRGVLYGDCLKIGAEHRHRDGGGIVASEKFAAALDHRRGVVDGDNVTLRLADPLAHGEGDRPEGTTEVITVAAGLGITRREETDGGDHHPVAGDRALNHVGKDGDDPFIELKIDHFREGRGIDGIGFIGNGFLIPLTEK